jgi:hypothetical protein
MSRQLLNFNHHLRLVRHISGDFSCGVSSFHSSYKNNSQSTIPLNILFLSIKLFNMSSYNTARVFIRDHPYNYTVNSSQECTLTTCSILQAQYTYDPSLSANAIVTSIFGLLLLIQLALGIYYRTIGFSIAMSCGLILEIIGYIGRVQMHFNPFIQQPFMM